MEIRRRISFFDCGGKGASPETNDFRCNFRFTRLLIVRERVGIETKVTPLSNSQGMSSVLEYIMGLIDAQ